MDAESLRYPSLCLFHLLERIIDTKENLDLRRKYNSMDDYVMMLNMPYKVIFSGSRGEGFNIQSSDVDLMYVDRNTTVLGSIHDTRSGDDSKTELLMRREGCKPGFVILQLLNRTNDHDIRESLVEYHSFFVLSSLLYRDQHRNPEYGEVGHGPCNTRKIIGDIDIAYCFECDTWPTEANEFIHRHRPYGWPQKSLLDKIISRGCQLVPIGEKENDLSHIQWRLSFSAAEKDLVHSFNHTQFLVYGLMKIFLKQFINKFHFVEGILCSYFLKTAMFYSIECTQPSFWREDLLILCFWFCLNMLIKWVEVGYCPNYFVPQNNMFRGKVFGENQQNLLTVLYHCKCIGWTCIYLCEDLHPLQIFVNHLESLHIDRLLLSEQERESESDNVVFGALCSEYLPDSQDLLRSLANVLTALRYSRTQQEEDISTLMLYAVLRNIGRVNACISINTNNKDKYVNFYHMLLASSSSNRFTGLLYLATFYYVTRQYKKAVHLCNCVISQWRPYVTYHSLVRSEVFNTGMYRRYVCGRGISVLDKAKSAYAFNMFLKDDTKQFYPAELHHDIEASAPFALYIPPLPYTVFLIFLCHHNLGNIDESIDSLQDLQVLVRDEQQGCRTYPIVLNLLAVCQDKLGDVYGAIVTCLQSLNLKPEKTGAVKMLEALQRQCT